MNDDRVIWAIQSLIADYVQSPSLKHIRDPHSIYRLSGEIAKAVERRSSVWRKWTDDREMLARPAAYLWVPIEDLRAELNSMKGDFLTSTDVTQRLRAFNEEAYEPFPQDDFREACLELYHREQREGTEMAAIIGALQELVDEKTELRKKEDRQLYLDTMEANRIALQERLLSGADCKWTPINRSEELYCRLNGRAYRLDRQVDGTVLLYRIADLDDPKGNLLGRYRRRGDATKAVSDMAYKDEPKR